MAAADAADPKAPGRRPERSERDSICSSVGHIREKKEIAARLIHKRNKEEERANNDEVTRVEMVYSLGFT